MGIQLRTALLMGATSFVMLAAIVIGLVQSSVPDKFFQPAIHLDRSYCQSMGDDNCDGMIMSYESGWKCVPFNGGPLVC